MKKPRFPTLFLVYTVAIVCIGAGHWQVAAATETPASVQQARTPRIFPDYSGVVIPPNIAPLNFKVEEAGVRYQVELRSTRGNPLIIASRSASIRIPAKPWQALLRANAGEPLFCEVWAQASRGQWSCFAPVTNFIAREPIDNYLVYRRLKPLFNIYVNLGIYQRNLESFDERSLLENSKIDHDCLNCHTFLNRQPDTFALHIRASTNNLIGYMLLVRSNTVARVDKTMGFMSWHPSGRLLAFSANKLSLFYHTINTNETRDLFDARSDLGIYWIDSNRVVMPPAIALPDRNETWPAWSPDGCYLYYCSAPLLPIEQFSNVRYDLMRVSYDIEHDRWGTPEVLVSAQETGLSACQPNVSPDGRFVLFCLCRYGSFPVWQPSCDLWMMDLTTHEVQRLEINSDQSDSWHCWSGNSRWIVFSSKRLDGLFARPFFSYVDEQGRFHKPFLLPQEDPTYYDTCLQTFNVPELVQGPVTVKESGLAQAVNKPKKTFAPTTDSQQALHQEQTDKSGYVPVRQ